MCVKKYKTMDTPKTIKDDVISKAARSAHRFCTVLPTLGFYLKILGFFEAVGIFLGFFFQE